MSLQSSRKGKRQGSSSFLKKRTKKLLLSSSRTDLAGRVKQTSKSFLVPFFKKELLSWCRRTAMEHS